MRGGFTGGIGGSGFRNVGTASSDSDSDIFESGLCCRAVDDRNATVGEAVPVKELRLVLGGIGRVLVLRLYESVTAGGSAGLEMTPDERMISESLLLMMGKPMMRDSGNTSASGTFSGITSPRNLDIDFLRCSSRFEMEDFQRSSVAVALLLVPSDARLFPFE